MDFVLDAFHDTVVMLPLLYMTYLVIEYFNKKEKQNRFLFLSLQKYGPFFGALFGLVPQCGFSILASILYVNRNITLGTLLSVFIATSDEAIPLLLAHPDMYDTMIAVITIKIVMGMVGGWLVDFILIRKHYLLSFEQLKKRKEAESHSFAKCSCCYSQNSIWIAAFFKTMRLYIFIFGTTLVLHLAIDFLNEETWHKLLLSDSIVQPVLAALLGLIPNCVASVVLIQLYAAKTLSFASLIAGLITNSGLGLIVLWRYGTGWRILIQIVLLLLMSALLASFGVFFLEEGLLYVW